MREGQQWPTISGQEKMQIQVTKIIVNSFTIYRKSNSFTTGNHYEARMTIFVHIAQKKWLYRLMTRSWLTKRGR